MQPEILGSYCPPTCAHDFVTMTWHEHGRGNGFGCSPTSVRPGVATAFVVLLEPRLLQELCRGTWLLASYLQKLQLTGLMMVQRLTDGVHVARSMRSVQILTPRGFCPQLNLDLGLDVVSRAQYEVCRK